MKKIILMILVLIIFFSNINYANDLHSNMILRSLYVNEKAINYNSNLNINDLMTYEQSYNRTKWIIKYSREFNYMYDIEWEYFSIIIFSIIETETKFVNYINLDSGNSFGICSMQISTTEDMANRLKDKFLLNLVKNDTQLQIKYGVYYLYYLMDYYNDIDTAIIGYNMGMNLNKDKEKYREYYFKVIGRVNYLKNKWNIN